jgi:hypothetical protein
VLPVLAILLTLRWKTPATREFDDDLLPAIRTLWNRTAVRRAAAKGASADRPTGRRPPRRSKRTPEERAAARPHGRTSLPLLAVLG